jgi:PhzF family phenazine biosynthesis protein
VVDAFVEGPWSGNPAGVCLLDGPAPVAWMQAVAAELRCSETAFVSRAGERLALRWFTPTTEVDLCGHATVGAAHALWEAGWAEPDSPIRFDTASGPLGAWAEEGAIWVSLPLEEAKPVASPAGLSEALGVAPLQCLHNRLDLFAVLPDEASVANVVPDLHALAAIETRGVVVTAPGEGAPAARAGEGAATARDADYVLRFFGPRVGVDEDPVTGSAQSALGPYWAGVLGRDDLVARQLSPRGGRLRVRVGKAADAGPGHGAVRHASASSGAGPGTAAGPGAEARAEARAGAGAISEPDDRVSVGRPGTTAESGERVAVGGLAETVLVGRVRAPTSGSSRW